MGVVTPIAASAPAGEPTERSTLRLEASAPAAAAAPHDSSDARRLQLERELDRVQGALQAEQTSYAQQLNWLMLSQGIFLNAYLLVLVLGFSTPLPGKRWLLGGIAIFGAGVAILIYLALRGGRDAVAAFRQQRKELEASLHRDYAREPVFVPRNIVTRGLSSLAAGLLPGTFIAGWIVLSIYTLAVPVNGVPPSTQATAPTPSAPAAARTPPRAAPAARSPAPATGAAATQEAEPAVAAAPVGEANTPPATEPQPPRRTGFKW